MNNKTPSKFKAEPTSSNGSQTMPIFIVKGDKTPVPDSEYTANITNVEFTTYRNIRKCIKLTFEISDGQYIGRTLSGWINADPTNPNVSANTKLAKWYSVATNERLGDNDSINLHNFVGKVVVVKTKTNHTKFNNDFSNVEDIVKFVADISGAI